MELVWCVCVPSLAKASSPYNIHTRLLPSEEEEEEAPQWENWLLCADFPLSLSTIPPPPPPCL